MRPPSHFDNGALLRFGAKPCDRLSRLFRREACASPRACLSVPGMSQAPLTMSFSPPPAGALPMVVEPIFACPRVAHFRALQLGALMLLARAFWEGGAHPLPSDDTTLMLLSGLHARQWSEQRERVLEAWKEVQPRLASVYAYTHARRAREVLQAKRAGDVARNNKRLREVQAIGASRLQIDSSPGASLVPHKKTLASISHTIEGEIIPKRVKRGVIAAKFVDAVVA